MAKPAKDTPRNASDDGSGTLSNCTSDSIVHCSARTTSTINEEVFTENPLRINGTVYPFPGGLVMGKVREKVLSGVRTTMLPGRPTPADPSLSAAQTVTDRTSLAVVKLNRIVGFVFSQPVRFPTSAKLIVVEGTVHAGEYVIPSVSSIFPVSG